MNAHDIGFAEKARHRAHERRRRSRLGHTHQRSTPDALGQEIIDIYRIQGGKIAEHWDSVVPVSATPANPNTQF